MNDNVKPNQVTHFVILARMMAELPVADMHAAAHLPDLRAKLARLGVGSSHDALIEMLAAAKALGEALARHDAHIAVENRARATPATMQ